MTCMKWMSYHLWKWQWQLQTKAIILLLLRPDWLDGNSVESERVLFAQKSTMQKTTKSFTWERAVPKIIVPSICCAGEVPGISLAIEENLTIPLTWWSVKRTPKWKHCGILTLYKRTDLVITWIWEDSDWMSCQWLFEITYIGSRTRTLQLTSSSPASSDPESTTQI